MCVRARVRSVWRVEISGILKSSISRIHAFFTGGGSRSEATATLPQDRRHNIADVPAPWGVAPQWHCPSKAQGALRGAIARYDSDGRREVSCPLVLELEILEMLEMLVSLLPAVHPHTAVLSLLLFQPL